ncbi:MAG: dTMP kinase [Trueperaceae bacterium]
MTDAGRFVVFEGPEGAGKSTQVERLAHRLRREGREVLTTREPGSTATGDRVRALLLDPDAAIEPVAEFLLYAAARAQLVHERIEPALLRGSDVLCDRFAASSVAYQGYGRGVEVEWIDAVNAHATRGRSPDLTVLLDLPAEEGLARIAARGATDRLERADLAFHRRVRDGYLRLAGTNPGWVVVDARANEETVADAVATAVQAAPRTAEP